MAPRPYRMNRRAATAQETRGRIVRATYDLHNERGIAATSVRDIAQLADVGIGTVYHHFPTYDDIIRACGAHTMAETRPPTVEVLQGVEGLPARVERAVEELFAFYCRFPSLNRIRNDAGRFPTVAAAMNRLERGALQLIADAIRSQPPTAKAAETIAALLDFSVYQSLRHHGLSDSEAVSRITSVILTWLDAQRSPRARAGRKRR